MNLNTLASGNILYDDFELSQHSRLYAVVQALKEGNLDSVKDLVPGIEDPVSVSVEEVEIEYNLQLCFMTRHFIKILEEEQIVQKSVFHHHLCSKP